jgi:adenylate kinase
MTRRFQPQDPLVLVLLGPPGVGKGTQGRLLADAEGIPLLSTGDILRGAVREGTPLGRQAQDYMRAGELVPDRLIDDMMADRLAQSDAARGFILDGYPRTVAQVEALDAALDAAGRPLGLAVLFEVADEEVVRRLAGRRSCPGCGRAYHVEFDPPRERDVCDGDGEPLVRRDDDRPETIRHRLEVYRRETEPVAICFGERDQLATIGALGEPAEIHARLREAISGSRRSAAPRAAASR